MTVIFTRSLPIPDRRNALLDFVKKPEMPYVWVCSDSLMPCPLCFVVVQGAVECKYRLTSKPLGGMKSLSLSAYMSCSKRGGDASRGDHCQNVDLNSIFQKYYPKRPRGTAKPHFVSLLR